MKNRFAIKRYRFDVFAFNFSFTLIVSLPLFFIISFIVNHNVNKLVIPLALTNSFLSGFYLKIDKFRGINLSVFSEIVISFLLLLVFISKETFLLLFSIILSLALAYKFSKVVQGPLLVGVVTNYFISFLFIFINLFLFNIKIVVQNTFISSFIALLLQDIFKSREIDMTMILSFDKRLSFSGEENVLVFGGLGGFDQLYLIPFVATSVNFIIVYMFGIHIPFDLENLL
ncbi:DUF1614 domain-containing protein [Sulfurisphaera ohwakuensis]|uniref:Uncharacterized protein n=1 Tax=Sulfurisphaera ohwakuensis TaxID=69656 RepID=A0A650CF69_SULOH|nr:DUF1614 domain-containing protein [Sulfurisphaera ohwakuensis]MBB5255084.1 hypothetical protein [Sulfurisphaera ohwakuensis]QGR16490.1 hypothetical protein D1869_04205 [Sulfurisphaera ohwakuensis]